MTQDWNPDDHQGKSQKNVETSYRILLACILIGAVIFTWGFIYKLIEIIF